MSRTKPAKPQGENAALKHRIERAEAIVSALVADVEAIKQRLAKVETAVAGPQTPDVAGDVTNSDPQMPQTE